MTAHELVQHREQTSMFPFGMKMTVAILISLFLLVAIWYTAPSTLSPTRLSTAQLEAFLSSPVVPKAYRSPSSPPHPSVSTAFNVTEEELEQSVSVSVNNFSANEIIDDEFGEFNYTTLRLETPQGSPFSEQFNSSIDYSNVSPLDPEPLAPIATRRSDSGSSNYEYEPSHSPDSNSSGPLQDPTTEIDDNPLPNIDDDTELNTKPPGPAQNPVNNEAFRFLAPFSLPTPSPAPGPSLGSSTPTPLEDLLEPEQQQGQEERYMFPMLSSFVGTGNQLMEYKSAAVIARTLNRTLCLAPFFGGPQRHFGYLGTNHRGLHIEDRYNLKELSRFVKLVNIDDCVQKCNGTLDRIWKLRSSRPSSWAWWFPHTPEEAANFDRRYGKWSSPADIENALGKLNEEPAAKCVGMGGAFPGLRWRGAMWAASAYMIHSQSIMTASAVFQARAIGTDPYISVHWRFEESNCRGQSLGLCFTRCADGALIGGGLKSPRYMELPTVMGNFPTRVSFHGSGLTKEDISAAIYDKAVEHGVRNAYLSTDGWLRGNESKANIKWVVEDLRTRGLNVSGLWEIEGLPNFADGIFTSTKEMPKLFGLGADQKVSNHMIALVEQEICARSVVFLGSGQSSWSLAVFDARRSRRRRLEFEDSLRNNQTGSPLFEQDVDQAVIQHLYKDNHAAGPACQGFVGGSPETYEDEAPDGWLDFEACEKRIDLGGKCVRLVAEITQ